MVTVLDPHGNVLTERMPLVLALAAVNRGECFPVTESTFKVCEHLDFRVRPTLTPRQRRLIELARQRRKENA